MRQHGSKYFACRPLPDPAVGVKSSTFKLSEHSHVAYQIKENQEYSNILANSLPTDPLPRNHWDRVNW